MKIMVWNILASEWIKKSDYPNITKKTLFNRTTRIRTILDYILKIDADIILLQEVMKMEYKLMYNKLKQKYMITPLLPIEWMYPNEYNEDNESGNITFIRKGLYPGNATHTKLDFGIHTTISNVSIVNLHLDDWSSQSRHKQLKSIDSLLYKSDKCIVGGDFNQPYSKKSKLYSLPYFTVHNTKCPTYYIETVTNIDNILTRGYNSMKSYCNLNISNVSEDIFTQYGSDHLPFICDVK
jgi:endonuclease/exonuclease/phosphatase family metal-dependent hydrolase